MRVLGRTEGVFGEPAGVTATAGVIQAVADGLIRPDETVTVISTGQRAQGREKRAARGGQAAAVRARPGRAGGERHPRLSEAGAGARRETDNRIQTLSFRNMKNVPRAAGKP